MKKYLKISGVRVTGVPARTRGTTCNGEKNIHSNKTTDELLVHLLLSITATHQFWVFPEVLN